MTLNCILAPSPHKATTSPAHVSAMMDARPPPICCINCHNKQLTCEAHPCIKGSCYHCVIYSLQCLFPSLTIIRHGSPVTTNVSLFQRNCVYCKQNHQRCVFNPDSQLQSKRCIKFPVTCLFKLSSQGRHYDLIT